ncbi:MAG: hypothetical protein LC655_07810 [Bacteroidales bacterium]|nr:hypothetical protein [Bacteroidales bacterium]
MRALIKYWVQSTGDLRAYLKNRGKDILDSMRRYPDPADGETLHVSQALGALFGAGDFMKNRKVLLWDVEVLKTIFCQLGEQWVTQHKGVLPEHERALLATLAALVEELEPDLVSLDSADIRDTTAGLGWRDDRWLYLAGSGMTRIALKANRSPDEIVTLLQEQGLLQGGKERGHKFRMTSRIAGRPRAFRISRDLLSFAPDGDGFAENQPV